LGDSLRNLGAGTEANASAVATRVIVVAGFEGLQMLDVTGPLEVFAQASRELMQSGRSPVPAYRVHLAARTRGPVASSSGLSLVADLGWEDLPAEVDTFLVSGGKGTQQAIQDPEFTGWISRQAPRARRFGSVCTGALVLARTGLLDGRRVTTHWAFNQELARAAPTARVEPDSIFVRDGQLWTSAGVTAGMDMALAMVEEDWGRKLALDVAHALVMYLKRAGGSPQLSTPLEAQALSAQGRFRQLTGWIVNHPEAELSITALAEQANMSPRHFARCFQEEFGVTPAKFVERVRLEAAQQLLASGDDSVEQVALRCGFGSAETLRRVFIRRLGVGPAAYRLRVQRELGQGD
jgi:transcriptional regulator GlxA family with amidase domain